MISTETPAAETLCKCGHVKADHHADAVTGQRTYCNVCMDCERYEAAAEARCPSQRVTPGNPLLQCSLDAEPGHTRHIACSWSGTTVLAEWDDPCGYQWTDGHGKTWTCSRDLHGDDGHECCHWVGYGLPWRTVTPEPSAPGQRRRKYCTSPAHGDGDHDASCMPPADPADPELRLIRAIFGLCGYCDRTDEHDHDEEMG